jgi:exonuclease III
MVVEDFNTPVSSIDRPSRQKINKETLELNNTIYQINLINVYRVFHSATVQYTLFSDAHRMFSKIDHILGLKASLNKYKKLQ